MIGRLPIWLPPGHRLERDPEVLPLCCSDDSVVGNFSARGFERRSILRVVKDDMQGYPQYGGPAGHEVSVRRLVRLRMESPWNEFMRTQRRLLRVPR